MIFWTRNQLLPLGMAARRDSRTILLSSCDTSGLARYFWPRAILLASCDTFGLARNMDVKKSYLDLHLTDVLFECNTKKFSPRKPKNANLKSLTSRKTRRETGLSLASRFAIPYYIHLILFQSAFWHPAQAANYRQDIGNRCILELESIGTCQQSLVPPLPSSLSVDTSSLPVATSHSSDPPENTTLWDFSQKQFFSKQYF